jgi:predicted enzyme related to lactoylglutathione lyase
LQFSLLFSWVEQAFKGGKGEFFAIGFQRFTQQQVSRGVIRDGLRITIAFIAQLKLSLVIGAPEIVGMKALYAIKFVADMDKAVKFYRDVLGLKVKFESPGWSEFVTGETTLALHPASDKNPAGKVELGFTVADVETFYRDMSAKGVLFSMPPKKQDFGGVLAQFVDSEGAHCSVGAEAA